MTSTTPNKLPFIKKQQLRYAIRHQTPPLQPPKKQHIALLTSKKFQQNSLIKHN